MGTILAIFTATVRAALYIVDIAMLIRAVLSFLAVDDLPENAFVDLVFMITEPVILPFRFLVSKSTTLMSMPIDMAFLFAALTVSLISSLLPSVSL